MDSYKGDYVKQTWAMVIAILVMIIIFNLSTLVLVVKSVSRSLYNPHGYRHHWRNEDNTSTNTNTNNSEEQGTGSYRRVPMRRH